MIWFLLQYNEWMPNTVVGGIFTFFFILRLTCKTSSTWLRETRTYFYSNNHNKVSKYVTWVSSVVYKWNDKKYFLFSHKTYHEVYIVRGDDEYNNKKKVKVNVVTSKKWWWLYVCEVY